MTDHALSTALSVERERCRQVALVRLAELLAEREKHKPGSLLWQRWD